MSRDELNELAALYAVDLLEGEELRLFEAELASNAEARVLLQRHSETADLIAFTADEVAPPADLEQRIFDQIEDLEKEVPFPVQDHSGTSESERKVVRGSFPWFPWGLAAVFALTSSVLWTQRAEIYQRFESLQAEYSLRVESLESEYGQQVASLESEVRQLESDGALQNLRISVLKSRLESAPNAQAVAVWNAAQQAGRLTVSELPALADNQDYQLWIIDPAYETPVSAGVFNTSADGTLEYSFSGSESISSINAFALSLESKGGNATPLGPIILVSN